MVLMIITGFDIGAQEVNGYVKDKKNGDPIPFSNVWIKGTGKGIMADDIGFFRLSLSKGDTLSVSSLGYYATEIPAAQITNLPLIVMLSPQTLSLSGVTIKPEVSRAKVLFDKIQEHKRENRQAVYRVSNYKTLETKTVYLAVDSGSAVIRSFSNLNDVTIKIDNQNLRFSPIYLSEEAHIITNDSTSLVYSKKDGIFPRINQTIETVIIDNVVVDMDFYKDQVIIMDRGFVSPLSNSALAHYNLYLDDSTTNDSSKYYHFSFVPKNRFDPLFSGHFSIEDQSFALTAIDVYIMKTANLNFVNGFKGQVKYAKQPDGSWFYQGQNVGVNLALSINNDSASNYSSKRIDHVTQGNWLINKYIQYSRSASLEDIKAKEWKIYDEFTYDSSLANAYSRVGRLKEHEIVKGIDKIGGMVLSGYFNLGKIDIGPVFDIYSTNSIEGVRTSIPLRTSEQMFQRFSVGGFLAYGSRNKEFKYGFDLAVQPQPTDRFIWRFYYSNNYNLVSQDKFHRFIKNNPNNRGTGNFIALFTSRAENPYLKEEESYEFRMEYNAWNGNHLEISPYLLSSTNTEEVRFVRNDTDYKRYKNYGILFDLRLAFGQAYDKFYFDRIYYISNTPVVHLSLDIGQSLLPGQKMADAGMYAHAHGSIQGRLTRGQLFMNYIVNAGYLFGDAPYDLLDQPVGSMSLGYSKDRFNLLHFASFAHNAYANIHMHVNGGGILLNRVPLVKKLKLREVISFKSHVGELNNAYQGVFDLPGYYNNDIKKPYAEIGFGLTNIFKVLRIEYVHLLGSAYKNSSFADRGGIRLRMEMSF